MSRVFAGAAAGSDRRNWRASNTAMGDGGRRSMDAEEFDVEDQRGVRRDHAACTAGAVAHFRRDSELAFPSHLHSGHSLVPTLDDLSCPESELERLSAVYG